MPPWKFVGHDTDMAGLAQAAGIELL